MTAALWGILLGSAVQLHQTALWSIWIYAAFAASAPLLFGFNAIYLNSLAHHSASRWCWLAAFALLAFATTGMRASHFESRTLSPALEGLDLRLTGTVAAMPQAFALGERFRFAPDSAIRAGQAVTLPALIDLTWYGSQAPSSEESGAGVLASPRLPAAPRAGERWQFSVRLKAVHGSVNPYGFDYELWQWEQGVQATGYVRNGASDPLPVRLATGVGYPMARWREQVRQRIMERLPDPQSSGLIAALVVGDQRAIDRDDWLVFRATGVAHLVSISGLHITMFAWLAARVVGWLWRRSSWLCLRLPAVHAALLGGVGLALFYALFSGFGVPAQRTILMLACVGLLRLSGTRWPWPSVWLLACAAVVVLDPWAMLQAGFWLSFVAVGILFATDYEALKRHENWAGGHFYTFFMEQWVITLALTPLSLLLFGQVSLVGIPANALAIPWITLLVTPAAMLGVLLPGLWEMTAIAVSWMMLVLAWLAGLPWAVWSVAQAPLWAAVVALLGGFVMAMRLPWSLRVLGLPMVLPVVWWQMPVPAWGEFDVLAADVGQGSAVLVRTSGHALMFDAGPRYGEGSDAGQRVLAPMLRALGVQLDTLLLSHRDSDHVGGAPAVLAMQSGTTLLSSFADAAESGVLCRAGQHWRWDGVDFRVLHPPPEMLQPQRNTNAASCVLHVSNGESAALLTGDIEVAQEAGLAATNLVKADLLVVPHHGSKTSSSAQFLDAVSPRVAVVQAGYRNRFGHPDPLVLARYRERGILVLDTPHCGAVMWRSGSDPLSTCQRQQSPRYWHHRVPN
ncbi:MAG: DNA internalization-related competence protein ComEC/Rec2 [Rhodoferax sp.]|uniref:DNA internalization-related competence protein ComEC/Rec2 n=1 Tax=Rhodoferax sp. TaxID=50421 RepID=UPI001B56C14D|nr:DNA internalization-related competence protein ComEC/Rec2 [Rhodoferax sp.]MBP9904187.1 DNA internalization-related competence protein ComEC/Rec2 [Rhodoferax sp.]